MVVNRLNLEERANSIDKSRQSLFIDPDKHYDLDEYFSKLIFQWIYETKKAGKNSQPVFGSEEAENKYISNFENLNRFVLEQGDYDTIQKIEKIVTKYQNLLPMIYNGTKMQESLAKISSSLKDNMIETLNNYMEIKTNDFYSDMNALEEEDNTYKQESTIKKQEAAINKTYNKIQYEINPDNRDRSLELRTETIPRLSLVSLTRKAAKKLGDAAKKLADKTIKMSDKLLEYSAKPLPKKNNEEYSDLFDDEFIIGYNEYRGKKPWVFEEYNKTRANQTSN